jgi:4-hydroxy-tetrahydrodipicolinate reductase
MKLAFFGAGAMGRAVQQQARDQRHTVGAVFDIAEARLDADELAAGLAGHDAAIDFSVAAAVPLHVTAALRARVPLVVGTTGWQDQEATVRRQVEEAGGAMLYGANFSVGVNLFYRVVERAGELFGAQAGYDVFIEEEHHRHKRDAPSGTALALARTLRPHVGREVPVASTRAGDIPGVHRVGFDGGADHVVLTHTARSREGFAGGALLGARWLVGRRGVYTFAAVLDDVLRFDRKERQA